MQETALSPKTSYTLAVTNLDGTTAHQDLGICTTVRLVASVDMFVNFALGADPVAALGTGMFLPAFAPEYFSFSGDTLSAVHVAALVASATGTLYVTKMQATL
jgi:hypothetical protein